MAAKKQKKFDLSDRSAPISWARGSFGKAPKRKLNACERVERAVLSGFTALRSPKASGYRRAKATLRRAELYMVTCSKRNNGFGAVSYARSRLAMLKRELA